MRAARRVRREDRGNPPGAILAGRPDPTRPGRGLLRGDGRADRGPGAGAVAAALAVPTATVACAWREAVGPGPLEQLRDLLLAGIDAEHREHDCRAVLAGALEAGSIDGSLIRVPDTPANRAGLRVGGHRGRLVPYPQLRELRLSNASTRAALAVAMRPVRRCGRRRAGQGRGGAEAAGQGPGELPAPVHQPAGSGSWTATSRALPRIQRDARDRHARADPASRTASR